MHTPAIALSYAAIIAANLILGINVPVVKDLLANWLTPAGYILSRTLVACFVFFVVSFFTVREKVPLKDLFLIAVGGLMGFVISQYLTALSLNYTTPIRFAMIVALSPVIVMLEAALLIHEKITRRKVSGVILSVLGALLLMLHSGGGESGASDLTGILLAFVSCSAFGLYVIAMRNLAPRYHPLTQMKWLFLFTTLMVLPLGGSDLLDEPILSDRATPFAYAELAFLILFATILSYMLIPYGMRRVSATNTSVIMNLQPLAAAVVSIAVGQDVFSWDKPVAAILVITGALLVSIRPGVTKSGNTEKRLQRCSRL